jgi:hypothetical protein
MTKPSKQSLSKADNIVFFDPDDPRAAEALRAAVSRSNIPAVGLILKVKESDQGEKIVNWMYADEDFIKSLALILPGK